MNCLIFLKKHLIRSFLLAFCFSPQLLQAAISVDRTRAVFDGSTTSLTISVTNQNKQLPYLAQAWIEDDAGNKINGPLVALPPIQRIEPGAKSQVKIQAMGATSMLSQNKESVFYFNVREIPPRSDKPNTLQIALQTRIKLFYRPASLMVDPNAKPWQESLTLSQRNGMYIANNPTPYFVTISMVSTSENGKPLKSFKPIMISPNSSASLDVSTSQAGNAPVLTYVNDYGGRPRLVFKCIGDSCQVIASLMG